MFKKVSGDLRFVEREKEILRFWNENDVFQKSIDARPEGEIFTFYDGPPTANGKPHIGHVLTRVIKDMIPRYRTMKGYKVLRKAGWDTHGLPVELEVEKELGLEGKEQVEEYGLEPFIARCKESVWRYKGMWEKFSGAVGFWADMENPYVTYHNDYIESEWWALKQIWERGLLYKGFKVVPYCPHCGTPLSSHEVAQGYKTVKERSAVVRFRAVGEDAWFLAWTTTPWTLPSNVALCVNPRETYCKVAAADGYTYYMAEALLDAILGRKEDGTPAYTVLERYTGKELEGRAYEPLYEGAARSASLQKKKAHFVTCADYVTMSDGTGIVHIAPAFGEDDAKVGRAYDLPFVQFVDGRGLMTGETPFAGLFVKDADPKVLQDLDARGLLFSAPRFEHDYPHCWRCDTPLLYYARDSWFIRMSDLKDELLANNATINWIPESVGTGRFGDWLANVQDWGISRNRYWGTPLNIWECACGHRHAVGSIEELKSMSPDCPAEIELHRPFIDDVTLTCPVCGGSMHRVKEVIDCWFDSGAMPFAQWHYPFENQDLFEKQFPADFISEAVDQTRGWFYSLLAVSTLLFHKAPFRNVIVLGHVLDEFGQKMSKSKGNAVDPMEALEKFGADAIRWYFYSNSAPWLPNRFHDKAVVEGQRKFLGTLWNTYSFFVLYANIDGFDPTQYRLDPQNPGVMDRWLLSRLQSLITTVDGHLANYRVHETADALDAFVDEMSNWYVRRCRERYWVKGMPQDKINAYMTLYTALITLTKLAAPMVPFMAEEIYRNLVCSVDPSAPESVHLCDFPVADPSLVDTALEASMEEVLAVVAQGRAARNAAAVKTRQPLPCLYYTAEAPLDEEYCAIIAQELNVKEVRYTEDASAFTTYSFKPQLKTVGPRYGRFLGEIRTLLTNLDSRDAMRQLNEEGHLRLPLSDGSEAMLDRDDLLIEVVQTNDFATVTDRDTTVVLDLRLTPALVEEGFVRELVSKLQTMRKDSGFEVTDHIRVGCAGNDRIADILSRNAADLCGEVLCDDLQIGTVTAGAKAWDINGENVQLSVEKM